MKECSVCKQPTSMERLKNDADPNSGYEPLCNSCSAERDSKSKAQSPLSSKN